MSTSGVIERMPSQPALSASRFFDTERVYPNEIAQGWFERLVGIDGHKERLLVELELLLYPDRLAEWSRKHHQQVLRVCDFIQQRAPLILLEGDVGCGKTALAETVGDALARRTGNSEVRLLKVNTQVRGSGPVGEMSDLIAKAFTHAETRADELEGKPLLLLIDEADALASTREEEQMHHEDKVGINTLLQQVDNLRISRKRIAVIFITNRPDVLDPAIHRRAALRLTFNRPNDEAREHLLKNMVPELSLNEQQLRDLVRLTGPAGFNNGGLGFTASDITDRLLPAVLREAYIQGHELRAEDLIRHAWTMTPSPKLDDDNWG